VDRRGDAAGNRDVMTSTLDRSLAILMFSAWKAAIATERARIEREVMPLVGRAAMTGDFTPSDKAAILRAIKGEK
jgi:hypothetical protein